MKTITAKQSKKYNKLFGEAVDILRAVPKPAKKVKKHKRLVRVRKTPLSKLKRQADKLAGQLCRDRGECEVCGNKKDLQWAHIISRTYHNIRWLPQNAICLCQSCHYKFTIRPDEWIKYLIDNLKDTYEWLYSEKEKYVKIDKEFMEKTIKDLKEMG